MIPATPADLKTLDIYSPLSALPKNVDAEHDPLRRDADEPGAEPLTQRELARMKNKQALLAKIQEQEQAQAKRKAPEDEREVKKARSVQDPAELEQDVDVDMGEAAE